MMVIEKNPCVTTFTGTADVLHGHGPQPAQFVRVSVNPDYPTQEWVVVEVPNGAKTTNPERGAVEGNCFQEVWHLARLTEQEREWKLGRLPVDVAATLRPVLLVHRPEAGKSVYFWVVPAGWEMQKTGKYTGRMCKL